MRWDKRRNLYDNEREKINKDAVIPMFAHPTDSGFDLFTCEDITVSGGKKGIAKTGLIFEIPQGWGIQIKISLE